MFTALEMATDNYADHLDRAVTGIRSGNDDPESYFLVTSCWRILGICRLLGDADVPAFADCLARAGQAPLAFLRKHHAGMPSEPDFLCASKSIGFTSTVAAGAMDTARDIALLSRTSH